jgi:thermostable 8-oxoguanine DNA glycosylase
MIDPTRMTRYSQTDDELEETLLFAICVAGKNARTTAVALERFLDWGHRKVSTDLEWSPGESWKPFAMLRLLFAATDEAEVADAMKRCGLGCYNQRCKSFLQACCCDLDLRRCSPQDIETIYGVAEKTSRFFILHSREGADVVPIDTHWLKYLRTYGYTTASRVPKGKRYLELESKVRGLIRLTGRTTADFDLALWNSYSSGEIAAPF